VEVKPRQVENYLDANNKSPYEKWMETLIGQKIHGIILTRIERVKKGLLGDWGPVGEGASELIIDFGPGYRVYYGLDGDKVILLNGGTKKGQSADIAAAKEYWRDYNA
jgi:putative addiction module killer protein